MRLSPPPTKKEVLDFTKQRNAEQMRKEKLRVDHLLDHETSQKIEKRLNMSEQIRSLESEFSLLEQKERIRRERRKLKDMEAKLSSISEARRAVRERIARQDEKLNHSLVLRSTDLRQAARSLDWGGRSDDDEESWDWADATSESRELSYVLVPKGKDMMRIHLVGQSPRRARKQLRKRKTVTFHPSTLSPKPQSPPAHLQRLWGLAKNPENKEHSPPPQRHEVVGRMKKYYDHRVKVCFSPTTHHGKMIQNVLRKEPAMITRPFQRVALGSLTRAV